MDCPICSKPMKKMSWSKTSNRRKGDDYKEYDKTLYKCEADDAWVETELPTMK